jgi:ketosteroid isomerase-like protein
MRIDKLLCFIAAVTLLLAGAPARAVETGNKAGISDVERLMIERECEALSNSYAHYLDFVDADGLAGLFAEDGVWFPSGRRLEGPKAIHDYWAAQAGRPYVTRHVMSNTRIEVIDRDHARGTAYLTMYRFDPAHPETIKSLEPALLGMMTDEYARTPQGWRFKQRKLEAIRPGNR